MTSIAFALSLLAQQPAPPAPSWRLVDLPDLHVGVRPAAYVSPDEWGVGVTVQITVRVL